MYKNRLPFISVSPGANRVIWQFPYPVVGGRTCGREASLVTVRRQEERGALVTGRDGCSIQPESRFLAATFPVGKWHESVLLGS